MPARPPGPEPFHARLERVRAGLRRAGYTNPARDAWTFLNLKSKWKAARARATDPLRSQRGRQKAAAEAAELKIALGHRRPPPPPPAEDLRFVEAEYPPVT